uniref:Uncharacterized protein n=1 Tax=Solanum lycopersicum TaxID=4081 RepID=A0A3Q7HN22_SOLLC
RKISSNVLQPRASTLPIYLLLAKTQSFAEGFQRVQSI